MADNAQVKQIKDYIVRAYKRGVCTKDGGHIPKEKRGMAGKGCHYIGQDNESRRRFRENFDLIDWSKP